MHLRRSPSISTECSHPSDSSSTFNMTPCSSPCYPALRRLQALLCVHCLESTLRHSLVEATQALWTCATCFHAPEVGHHQHHAVMSSLPIPPPFSVSTDSRRSIRLTSLTQPNLFGCMTRSRLPNRLPRILIHHLIIPS